MQNISLDHTNNTLTATKELSSTLNLTIDVIPKDQNNDTFSNLLAKLFNQTIPDFLKSLGPQLTNIAIFIAFVSSVTFILIFFINLCTSSKGCEYNSVPEIKSHYFGIFVAVCNIISCVLSISSIIKVDQNLLDRNATEYSILNMGFILIIGIIFLLSYLRDACINVKNFKNTFMMCHKRFITFTIMTLLTILTVTTFPLILVYNSLSNLVFLYVSILGFNIAMGANYIINLMTIHYFYLSEAMLYDNLPPNKYSTQDARESIVFTAHSKQLTEIKNENNLETPIGSQGNTPNGILQSVQSEGKKVIQSPSDLNNATTKSSSTSPLLDKQKNL